MIEFVKAEIAKIIEDLTYVLQLYKRHKNCEVFKEAFPLLSARRQGREEIATATLHKLENILAKIESNSQKKN